MTRSTRRPRGPSSRSSGGFFGDYTDITVGPDNVFRALYTDSNDLQTAVWFYGFQFVPTSIHQEDIVTVSGSF